MGELYDVLKFFVGKKVMTPRKRGFTLVEMLVVLAIVIVLLAMLLPVAQNIRESARATQCANNQHQMGVALQKYIASFSKPPTAYAMLNEMGQFLAGQSTASYSAQSAIYNCPSSSTPASSGPNAQNYGANMCLDRLVDEASKIAVTDAYDGILRWTGVDQQQWGITVAPRHGGSLNVLFFDGSVQRMAPTEIDPYDPLTGTKLMTSLWKPKLGCSPDKSGSCSGGGLVAEYWSDSAWARPRGGPADITRVDKSLTLPFGEAYAATVTGPYPFPDKRYPSDSNGNGWQDCAFQARWRGYVYAPCSGTYTLYVYHDDNCWVDIEGANRFYRYCCGWATSNSFSLTAGWKQIEVRFDNDRWQNDYLTIEWSSDCGVARKGLTSADLRCP